MGDRPHRMVNLISILEMGQGTKITIKVPLDTSDSTYLDGWCFGSPFVALASVNEIFHLDLSRTNVVDGQLTIIVRDKSIPLFYLQLACTESRWCWAT